MKYGMLLITIVAVLLCSFTANAQVSLNQTGVAFSNFTYAAGETDTSAGQYVAGANRLSLVVTSKDSANLRIIVQYKVDNATWTTCTTDTLLTVSNTGASKGISLIDSDSDMFDGVAFQSRVLITGIATGNGVTSPTFTAKWVWRP